MHFSVLCLCRAHEEEQQAWRGVVAPRGPQPAPRLQVQVVREVGVQQGWYPWWSVSICSVCRVSRTRTQLAQVSSCVQTTLTGPQTKNGAGPPQSFRLCSDLTVPVNSVRLLEDRVTMAGRREVGARGALALAALALAAGTGEWTAAGSP